MSTGSIYAALDRLEQKGYAKSSLVVTSQGAKTLKELKQVREQVWTVIEEGGRS